MTDPSTATCPPRPDATGVADAPAPPGAAQPAVQADTHPGVPPSAANRRILVVDDNHAIHDDFRKILCPESTASSTLDSLEAELFAGDTPEQAQDAIFTLAKATQGREGLALVEEARQRDEPFAAAFVDIRMPPGWDGLETAQHLWKADPDLQIVFCTAYSDYTWQEMVETLPRTERWLVLKKPFDNVEVRQLALALTEKWNLLWRDRNRLRELADAVDERTKQLQEAHSHLLQADKLASIGQLAAGVAHEINNPIGFISSNLHSLKHYAADLKQLLDAYAGLAEGMNPDDPAVQQVQTIRTDVDADFVLGDLGELISECIEGTQRVRQIVKDLRDFSHIDAPDVSDEDLNALLDKTVNVAWNELKYKATVERQYGELPPVPCFGGKVGQVLLNLLVNAAHALKEQGTVTLRTGVDGDHAWIEIEDTGCGMPPEVLARIYEPFFTTKEVGRGTGMGLHLAYKIMQAHGGSIDVRSVVGQGTTFRLELPLSGPPASEENPS